MYLISILHVGNPEDLYQVALMIDQLKHDDAQLRVNAAKNLAVIGNYELSAAKLFAVL